MSGLIGEISSLLEDGPKDGKDKLYFQTFDLLLSLTDEVESERHIGEDLLKIILKYLGHNSQFNGTVYKILINIFSNERLSFNLCRSEIVMNHIINFSFDDIYNNSNNADYSCMLLSNVTRSEKNCLQVLNYLNPLADKLHKMVSVFTTVNNNSCSLDQLSMVLCNLSQLAEVRTILTQTENLLLQKLVPFITHENATRRKGIIGLVHNCSFNTSIHSWLLSEDIDILPRLLLPLAGPDQFDDEDNDKLPIDLQYLPETKTRETNPDIRKQLLETLNQLCATKFGRLYLRDHNTYLILRELHKWEEHQPVLLACENVVDILIRTEDEIGFEDFTEVEIPADLEEKFNKDLSL